MTKSGDNYPIFKVQEVIASQGTESLKLIETRTWSGSGNVITCWEVNPT